MTAMSLIIADAATVSDDTEYEVSAQAGRTTVATLVVFNNGTAQYQQFLIQVYSNHDTVLCSLSGTTKYTNCT